MNLRKTIYKISHWETWHWFIKYVLISPVYLYYMVRAKSIWFFTASNPSILFGGYLGENKKDTYLKMPPGTWPKSIFINPTDSLNLIESALQDRHLHFPLAVKPQSGLMGFMFRKIEDANQLSLYHSTMKVPYIIQEFIAYPLEVSVFYYRFPGERKGTITGFVKKEPLCVIGDGMQTLSSLISTSERVQFRQKEMIAKHADQLHVIPADGEQYLLSEALNLSRGGKLVSLEHEKDNQLNQVFDEISHYAGFMFGRYDIRCQSVQDLKAKRNFSILEFNGCGGEPHHVYGNHYTLWQACRILIDHWRVLYKLSVAHHSLGTPYWKTRDAMPFLKNAIHHVKQLKAADQAFGLRGTSQVIREMPSKAEHLKTAFSISASQSA